MLEGIKSRITKMMAPVESNDAAESVKKNVNSSMQPNSMDYSTIVEDLPLGYEAGRSGMKVWLPGYNGEEWLPALSGSLATQIYREMGDQDAYIAACLNAYRTFYRYARWHVEPVSDDPKDMEAAEFLEECMHDMRHGWSSFISECSSTPQYGFSLFEIVYKKRGGRQEDYRKSSKYSDGRIGWGNFSPRAQNTILHFDWLPSDPNYLIGYTQLTPPDYPTNLFIPLEKSILIRTEAVKDSPWGRSILRSSYRSWFMKKYLEDIRCTIIERGGAGIPMAKIPANLLNNTEYDEQGNVISVDYAALQSLNTIKGMLKGLRMTKEPYVIIPQQFDDNNHSLFDVGFLQSSGTDILAHINATIKELETAIMVSMMCEFLGVGTGGSGSMALAAVKSSNFTKAVTSHLHSIESSINNQCVPRLFEMNPEFDIEDLPRIVHDSIEEIPAADIANVLSLFMRVGWDLTGQDNLRDAILTGMGLPKLVDKDEESPFGINDGGEVTPEAEQFDALDEVATPDMSMPNRGKNAKDPITTEPTVDTKLGKSACECEEVIKFDESKIKRDGDGQFSSTGSSSSSSYGGRKKPGINRAGKQKVDAQHPYKTVVSVPGYDDMHSNNAYSANELENHVNGKMPEGQEFKVVDGETGDVVAHGVGGKGINWIKKAFDENKVKRDDGGKFSSTGGSSSSSPSSGDQDSPSATAKPKFQRFATGSNVAPRSEEHKPASTSTPTASAPRATTAKPMENHTPKADAKSGAKVTQTVAIQPKVERHRNRARNYKNHLPRTCANPKCTQDPNVVPHFEIHHIIPLSAKGEDRASNMVQVCPDCHRGGDLHSNWQGHVKELTEWKQAHDKSARKA